MNFDDHDARVFAMAGMSMRIACSLQTRVAEAYAVARAMHSDYVSLLALEAKLGIPAPDRDGGRLTAILCQTQERAAVLSNFERDLRADSDLLMAEHVQL